eukprot:1160440-Pelagomonas_calceolata.AAC.9
MALKSVLISALLLAQLAVPPQLLQALGLNGIGNLQQLAYVPLVRQAASPMVGGDKHSCPRQGHAKHKSGKLVTNRYNGDSAVLSPWQKQHSTQLEENALNSPLLGIQLRASAKTWCKHMQHMWRVSSSVCAMQETFHSPAWLPRQANPV